MRLRQKEQNDNVLLRQWKKRKVLWILLTMVILLFGVLGATKIYAYATREVVEIDGKSYVKRNVTTILLLGIDNRGEIDDTSGLPGENGQADMIALLVIDKDAHQANIITIPRETMVDVDQYYTDGTFHQTCNQQICLQYAYGTDGESGSKLMKDCVASLFEGIEIDEYCAFSMGAIDEIVEELDGVTVTMTEDHWIPGYEYKKGDTVTLTGEEAYEFIHFRDTTAYATNLDRMSRQKDFMTGLIAQVKGNGIHNFSLFRQLYEDLQPYMSTSIEKEDIGGLVWEALWIRKDDIFTQRISGEDIHVDAYDQYLVDAEKIHELVLKIWYK